MQDRININILNAYYGNMLSDKQKDIMRLYYDCDMSLFEVSEELGLTRQGVRESLVRSSKKLKEWESKLRIVEKVTNLTEELQLIINNLPIDNNIEVKGKLQELLKSIKEI